MKIVAGVRAFNEEDNIQTFYMSYAAWVDKIIIADGGSRDDTVRRAKTYEKAAVRTFEEQVEKSGVQFNPQGRHVNFLIDWAFEEEEADWFIFDDCDCFPNYLLRGLGRGLFETAEAQDMDAIFAYRLYIYKDKYFPRMNDPGQSLWAWSRRCKIRATERNPANLNLKNMPPSDKTLRIDHPYVLLHNSWPTEAAVQEKMRHYKAVRNAPQEHPLRFGGELAELPSYARVDTPPYSIEGVED